MAKHSEDIIYSSLKELKTYIEKNEFKGYDPYDALNSPFFPKFIGSFPRIAAIQVLKRLPINLRPLLFIKKGHNPKGLGLLLSAYSILYQTFQEQSYLNTANQLFDLIIKLKSKEYRHSCWGYNFDWVNSEESLPAYTPSVVVTSFVCDGLMEYYKISNNKEAKSEILSSCKYILDYLESDNKKFGYNFKYTHISESFCYNASLLGAETLAKGFYLSGDNHLKACAEKAVKTVLAKQFDDGHWNYSINTSGLEREQIDFHQGFLLVSLNNFIQYTNTQDDTINLAIKNGMNFYGKHQFLQDGKSYWRIPKLYPADIHHQAQGIITFTDLKGYYDQSLKFAYKIAIWTINNMFISKTKSFTYKKYKYFSNPISYMRWGQAWMMLALAKYLQATNN